MLLYFHSEHLEGAHSLVSELLRERNKLRFENKVLQSSANANLTRNISSCSGTGIEHTIDTAVLSTVELTDISSFCPQGGLVVYMG